MLQLGYKAGASVFNGKEGPKADFIIFVRLLKMREHECYVVPVAEAERVARSTAKDWAGTPKRDGGKRGKDFPCCIRFELNRNRPEISNYKERWSAYRNAWRLLDIL